MGSRSSKIQEIARSSVVEKELLASNRADAEVNKVLLLGAGESGKSTFFKQCQFLYGRGYSVAESQRYVPAIYANILQNIKALITFVLQRQNSRLFVQKHLNETIEYFIEMRETDPITPDIAAHVIALWNDPAIQVTYQRRSEFQLLDNCEYFMNKVEDVCKRDFIPSEQDIFRCRVRTTGIVETSFAIQGVKFRMFDVGGQRNERRKWIHCFENVNALIYIASMSVYDQVLFEDGKTNRMLESLLVFEEVCNSKWFRDTPIILFLNKCDLFAEKIKRTPITVTFPNFPGNPHDYEEVKCFLIEVFESRNKQDKMIYSHVTCATDTKLVNHVFTAVKNYVLRVSMKGGGLMM